MAHDHTHEHCDCHEEHGHHHGGHEHHHHHHEEHEGHHDHHGGHEHHHHHEDGGVKETAIKIGVATVLLIAAVIIEKNTQLPTWAYLLIYLVPYLVVGWETLKEAAEGLVHGEALSEDFLMSVATLGALGIGFMPGAEAQFPEAVFVMLFFQLGEMFEGIAEGRSRRSIGHLMDIRPDIVHIDVGAAGSPEDRNPADVPIGTIIIVKPGEKVPLDGIVLEGASSLDTVALTGESVPRSINAGDEILSGCVNLTGVLKVRTTKEFGESTASKILELVEHATEHKSRSESFITKFARIYT
ncbi:MAG: heavy metal translocating P-type ATPase, partial [Bacteroidales bacterium]|nr:heavy metal translocating P-type ATPase [Bacteroidales bacterium]